MVKGHAKNSARLIILSIITAVGILFLISPFNGIHVVIKSIKNLPEILQLIGSDSSVLINFLPDEHLIENSNNAECYFAYDSTYQLEEPVYYLNLYVAMSHHWFNIEVNRINNIIPNLQSSKVDANCNIFYYQSDLYAIDKKLDSVTWDGCMWDIRYILINNTDCSIQYVLIRVCDADSPIDGDVKTMLKTLHSFIVQAGNNANRGEGSREAKYLRFRQPDLLSGAGEAHGHVNDGRFGRSEVVA